MPKKERENSLPEKEQTEVFVGRSSLVLLVVLAVVGSWLFFNDVPLHRMPVGTVPVDAPIGGGSFEPQERIRIATFNLDGFDSTKAAQGDVVAAIAHIFATFDVIAVQEIESSEHHLLPTIVDQLNQRHGSFDFVVGPRVGRYGRQQQFGFVYNRHAVEIDRYATYTVNDPDDLINAEPLVCCFRAKGTGQEHAFTFTLVNIHTHHQEVDRENALLDDLFASVRNDGRGEDDVILLGNFSASAAQLQRDGALPGMTFIVGDEVWSEDFHDNLVLDASATTEFTGRSGVLDFLRDLNIDVATATRISRHFPVWAEFSVSEGGTPGYVAWGRMTRCTR